mmetsp:Transcript_6791/g.19665  ORF Transcript_6791/g.19665 Transcript_6791/m.19665 type:complete len:111 (-) Transcript_6791:56-388(-)
MDAADDLSWIVFFYSGAAKAAGQAYNGALVATADGEPPKASEASRIAAALQRGGVQPWEMYTVDNSACTGCGAPLGVERRSVRPQWLADALVEGKTIEEIDYYYQAQPQA